jgi:hypothetical protein
LTRLLENAIEGIVGKVGAEYIEGSLHLRMG